mmetsp:Transcript_46257/g.104872  ORF Transcript_46257/g.104872 Transcript_46257/m.104872 type:complete len:203 (-) Transcript_46257:114-722(-)
MAPAAALLSQIHAVDRTSSPHPATRMAALGSAAAVSSPLLQQANRRRIRDLGDPTTRPAPCLQQTKMRRCRCWNQGQGDPNTQAPARLHQTKIRTKIRCCRHQNQGQGDSAARPQETAKRVLRCTHQGPGVLTVRLAPRLGVAPRPQETAKLEAAQERRRPETQRARLALQLDLPAAPAHQHRHSWVAQMSRCRRLKSPCHR